MSEDGGEKTSRGDILRMTAKVVAAYVGKNPLATNQIPKVLQTIYNSMLQIDSKFAEVKPDNLHPAIPVKRSVTQDYIVCLEDGKKLKMLKRHLRTTYHMTPEEYRAKWGLPPDYPMVAPNYAAQRSEFAKKIGLGRKSGGQGASTRRGRRPRVKSVSP